MERSGMRPGTQRKKCREAAPKFFSNCIDSGQRPKREVDAPFTASLAF
jgi:hypothetical protein